jgi:hypothetical protein
MRHRALPIAITAAAALALAGCGGGPDPDQILDEAFGQPIGTAEVTLGAELQLEGLSELTEPIQLQVEGPYRSGADDELPAFDFDVSLGGAGLPVPAQGLGLISTGDNLFLQIGDTAYEAGEDTVAKELKAGAGQDEGGLGALGVEPRTWVEDPKVEGDEEVAGVQTTHLTGTISVAAMLQDLNDAAGQAASVGEQQAPPELTDEQLAQIEEIVQDPVFDLYVGKDDGKIRRLTAAVDFQVPEEDRAGVGGLSSGAVSFELEFANVGQEVQIEPPKDAQPLEDLAAQAQALGGGLVPGQGGGGSLQDQAAPAPQDQAPAPQAPGALPDQLPGGDGGQAFQDYADCLKEADPADDAALAACSEIISGR